VYGGRRLKIGGIGRVPVKPDDHGPMIADRAALETPIPEPGSLQRAQCIQIVVNRWPALQRTGRSKRSNTLLTPSSVEDALTRES